MATHSNPNASTFGVLNPVLANGQYPGATFYNGFAIQELSGRTGTDSQSEASAERVFLVAGSIDPLAAQDALEDGPLPIDQYGGLNRSTISHERIGPESWRFTVAYDSITPTVGGYTVSIDTTGGSIVQTYAESTTRFPATGETASDFGNAIDVQKDGENGFTVKGVSRVIPALKINVRAKIATAYVTSPIAYSKLVAGLTGYVNNAAMFGGQFAAGELLFTGATGEVVAKNPQLTFTFFASANLTNVDLAGGAITGVTKGGHEYLWIEFKDGVDASGRKVKTPRAAHVNKIYGEADLSLLRIGQP
ncbi:MAG: hypothetical protein AAFX06_30235 [Planctomycetota bacterium]